MKKLIAIACMTIVTLGVYAQPGSGRNARPDQAERIARATTTLSLSDSQVVEWEAIHDKYGDEMKAARGNREESQAVRQQMHTDLETTLTSDQKVKFVEMRKNQRNKGRGKGKGCGQGC